MSEKHTPGPLCVGVYFPTQEFLEISSHVAVMTEQGKLIATTGPCGDTGSIADANLYSVAPEYHELLVRAVSKAIDDQWLKAARAAIAKAEGRS